MTSVLTRIPGYSLSQTKSKLATQWLPDHSNFVFQDNAIVSPPAAVAMMEEDSIRSGWLLHPSVGIDEHQSMLDIGSRYGEYTLTALAIGAKHVYSFEKDLRLVKCLRENLRLNKNFIERCSVINETVSPVATTIDSYIFDELSVIPENLKWIKVDVGGQDEINIINGCYKTIEYYRPISIMMHLYGGMPEFNRFTETFLLANRFDCKSVVSETDKENELICNTLIY